MSWLSNERYLVALKRIRQLIVDGEVLAGYDCTDVGCKNNECSWGFCCETLEHWPDKEDQIWPELFPNRIAPKSRDNGQWCPLDSGMHGKFRDKYNTDSKYGCFYRCLFFQRKKPTKEQVLALYDEAIKAAEEKA